MNLDLEIDKTPPSVQQLIAILIRKNCRLEDENLALRKILTKLGASIPEVLE